MIYGKYLNPYYKKYGFQFIGSIIVLIIVDLLQIKVPTLMGDIIDKIVQGKIRQDYLLHKVLFLILIGTMIPIGMFIWKNLIFKASRDIEFNLRNHIFSHMEKMSQNYFSQHKTGDLMAHITNDIDAVRVTIGPGLLMIVDAALLIVLVFYKMIWSIDLKLTLLTIIPFSLLIFQGFIISKVMKNRFKEKQEAFAKMTDRVQESLSGIMVAKAFIQEDKEIMAFKKINKSNLDKNINLAKLRISIDPIIKLVIESSFILTLIYGSRLAMMNKISFGDLFAFISFLTMLVRPMMAVGMILNIIAKGRASMERIEKILDEPIEISDDQNVFQMKEIKGSIKIEDLSFKYPNSREYTLKNIKIDIKQGKTLGIIGKTGSGKTTLVNLLLRLYNVEQEKIILDEMDIMKIPLHVLRKNIGYVEQDNFLFSDTIRRNIMFGVDDIDTDKAVKSAELSNIHDNIIEFKRGYETMIGERGITLSGGQKQRISIARALIKDSPILILDDGVSAVDTDTEEQILLSLKKERKNKTTIIIAHRISTIKHADHIIFLEEGKIVEEGTHHELMSMKGRYYSIAHKQQLTYCVENG